MDKTLLKIEESYLEEVSKTSVVHYFGEWTNNVATLHKQFIDAEPFEHVVINDFLQPDYAAKLLELFPKYDETWHEYKNPIEVKYTYDNIHLLPPEVKNYFYYLSTPEMINVIRSITGIEDLEYDEYLHGAGVHLHPRYGRLNIHLDYEKHPFSGKERRINIILFMSPDWKPEWNGANELWNEDVTRCVKKTDVKFNSAIIFKTNDISWHGLPDKIMCPENVFRKSLAYYYVSPLNTQKLESEYRKKAKFIKRPQDKYNENMEKLYEIRQNRRITKEDMDALMPDWTVNS